MAVFWGFVIFATKFDVKSDFFVVFYDRKTEGIGWKNGAGNVKILSFLNKSITAGVSPGGREPPGKSQRFALRKDKNHV